jgi:hypothetical protein
MSGLGLVFNLIESGKECSGTGVVGKSFADLGLGQDLIAAGRELQVARHQEGSQCSASSG